MNLSEMAQRVQYRLQKEGVETPILPMNLTQSDEKKEQIAQHFEAILTLIGFDLKVESLQKTPMRMAQSYSTLFSGLDYQNFPDVHLMSNSISLNEMILVQDIAFISMCEHHLVPIDGKVTIAYVPKKSIVGLSKLSEIVHFFAARPQLQERFTQQLSFALQTILETQEVAILVKATHYCVKITQSNADQSRLKTMNLAGRFKNDSILSQHFFQSIQY